MVKMSGQESILKEFAENTSLHGARFFNSSSKVQKLIWFLAMAGSWIYCGRHIYFTIENYFEWPINTVITIEDTSSLVFPAVTICNFNRINMKNLKAYHPGVGEDTTALEKELTFIYGNAAVSENGNETDVDKKYSANFYRRGNFVPSLMSHSGYNVQGMLSFKWPAPCLWKGKPCGPENFTTHLNSKFGKCHTFNGGKDGAVIQRTTVVGNGNGLRLNLNLEQEQYMREYMQPTAGFKVLVHDQNEYPFVEQFGFVVQPGIHTYCSLRRRKMKNLPSPYKTKCGEIPLFFTSYYNMSYSKSACQKDCLLNLTIRECGCRPFDMPGKVEICAANDTVFCTTKVMEKANDKIAKCVEKCPETCSRVTYDTRLSYGVAISDAFIRGIDIPAFDRSIFGNLTNEEQLEFFRKNLVSLDIFYEELSYDSIEQEKAFEYTSLISDIGGTLGLFLGLSVLTVFEFIDLFLVLIWSACAKSNRVRSGNITTREEDLASTTAQ